MAAAMDLLERESQLDALAALLDSARRGKGRVALVHGEAGIGKTALVERFVGLQARAGVRLLWGCCDPLTTPLPLAPVLDVARLHGGALAERVELPPLRCRELHARMLAALLSRGEQPRQLARLVHHAARADDAAAVLRLAPAAAEHASRLGAHREAEQHLASATRNADALPPRQRAELLGTRRGDPDARASLDEAWELAVRSGEPGWLVPVAAARAELAWLSGDLPGTLAASAPLLDQIAPARRAWYVADLALWVWRAGGSVPETECAEPVALQRQGRWRAAAEAWHRLGCRYHAALACYESDDPAALVDALATLDRLGARPAAARVRRRLSELGVRSVPRGPRAAARAHPFGLTARQQEVLATLALGLSNDEIGSRLFVSPKTVDHHISAILAKLNVRSRDAAVAEAHRSGLLPPRDTPGSATSRG